MNSHQEALELAHGMLIVIENGGSFTIDAWADKMGRIEAALGKDTARSRIWKKPTDEVPTVFRHRRGIRVKES